MAGNSFPQRHKYSAGAEKHPIQISLDVHEDSTRIFALDMTTGEVKKDINVQGHYKKLMRHIQALGNPEEMMIIYEAGCHGFSPYRFFTKKHYACKVIAPSSIPRRSGDQKTDRDDAIHKVDITAALSRQLH